MRPQQMHPRLRDIAGDGERLVARGADLFVGGHRELQDHMRALVADAAEMPGMVVRGFAGAKADINGNSRCTQFRVPLARHFQIGILDRRHHAGNA